MKESSKKKLLTAEEFARADRKVQIVAIYDNGEYIASTTEVDLTVELYRYNGFDIRVEFRGTPRRLISVTVPRR